MNFEELSKLLKTINKGIRVGGMTRTDADRYAQHFAGMSYRDLGKTVGRAASQPKEQRKPLTTKDVARLELYGVTLGWLDEIEGALGALKAAPKRGGVANWTANYRRARDAARAEVKRVERDYPWARGIKYAAGGVTGLLGIAAAPALGAAGGATSLARVGAGAGALLGAGAGAGGLLGEEETLEGRAERAAGGLLGGAALGAGGAAAYTLPTSMLRTLAKYGAAGVGVGAGGGLLSKVF